MIAASDQPRKGSFRTPGPIWWIVAMAVLLLLASASPTVAQNDTTFQLQADQPIIDETGTSLTPEQIASLEAQLDELALTGADVVLYVRALNATPEETLTQVEALQQAWVAETGANQDTAVAVLINRNPDNPNDARAGIFVGRTYNDGNVPESEQRDIVNDVLIPPLRDGDVAASFSDTLNRLEQSILHGPPRNPFERWSSENGSTWYPWVISALAAVGAGVSAMFYNRRKTLQKSDLPLTTVRPGLLTPALAGALVATSPQASAFPATVLDLAARGALRIEPEKEGGTFSKPTIQARMLDHTLVVAPEEEEVWNALEKRATVGVVSSKDLTREAANTGPLHKVLRTTMEQAGWFDASAAGPRAMLVTTAIIGLVVAIFSLIVAAAGGSWPAGIAAAVAAAVSLFAFLLYAAYPSLSLEGQAAAQPWIAYRDGLKRAAKDNALPLNLDEVLADGVAFNLGSDLDSRMKTAVEEGVAFRAFTANPAYPGFFPWWVAYIAVVQPATGSSAASSTVSGGGAGGGGGAAGST